MTILLNPWADPDAWFEKFSELLPDEELVLWPNCPDPESVELLIAWRMERTDLATFTNLDSILSMGAGADQWLRDGSPDVRVVRLADPGMAGEMAAYAVHWVTHFHRGFDQRFDPANLDTWGLATLAPARKYKVGMLGFGQIGRRIGAAFNDLGYDVHAWSRSGVSDDWVSSFAGLDQLEEFLGTCDAIVNILPNTPETNGLLTATRFAQFKTGATFVNIGRGTVVADEKELVAAVDSGKLGAAALDVTNPEPPASDAAILNHPRIQVTPHIAGLTQNETAAELIAANVRRIRAGEDPFPVVDRSAGY